MGTRKTPQEKKKLSYAKDRRNVYGEKGSGSRHAIRRNKDKIERAARHEQKQLLHDVIGTTDEAEIAAIENAVRLSPKGKKKFRKYPDAPLGEVIELKRKRHAKQAGRNKKQPKS